MNIPYPYLHGGNPNGKPASFSRFVLPFAYQLGLEERAEGITPGPEYTASTIPEQRWRETYLTEETAEVLFKRARWFNLENKTIKGFFGERKVPISITPSLVLFECGVVTDKSETDIFQSGFLILDATFDETQPMTFDELLQFNEMFRYWQRPFDGHEIWLRSDLKDFISPSCSDDYVYFHRWEQLLSYAVLHDNKRYSLVPPSDLLSARQRSEGIGASPGWMVLSDNRAFVWTCAVIEGGANSIRLKKTKEFGRMQFSDEWIRLLNVDKPGSDQKNFHHQWAEPFTYTRWEHYGTLYGFTPHSGAMLCGFCEEPPICQHFNQMYFDQMLLLLYLRTTICRFSSKLHQISREAKDVGFSKGPEELREVFKHLRWQFVLFTNLYQFPQFSNQQQAMEMYRYARKALDIDDMFAEVEKEIHTTDEYLSAISGDIQSETGTLLSVVATLGLPVAVIISLFGIESRFISGYPMIFKLAFAIVFLLFAAFIYKSHFCRKFLEIIAEKGRESKK